MSEDASAKTTLEEESAYWKEVIKEDLHSPEYGGHAHTLAKIVNGWLAAAEKGTRRKRKPKSWAKLRARAVFYLTGHGEASICVDAYRCFENTPASWQDLIDVWPKLDELEKNMLARIAKRFVLFRKEDEAK